MKRINKKQSLKIIGENQKIKIYLEKLNNI